MTAPAGGRDEGEHMAPDKPAANEAYEQDWYRAMKALAERRGSPPPEAAGDVQGAPSEALGLAQLAAIEAVDALGEIGGAGAVTALIECLEDPDAPVRIRVLETLGEIGDRRSVPAIRALAHADPDPTVVNVAKNTLAKLDAP
jgi:HEAT repeat protein